MGKMHPVVTPLKPIHRLTVHVESGFVLQITPSAYTK